MSSGDEHREQFHTLFERMGVGVAMLDSATGRLLRVNRAYTEIVGYTEGELLDLDFMRLTHPDDLAADLAQMEQIKTGAIRSFTLEKRLLRKDGAQVWIELTVSPLWNPGESPSSHVAVIHNIARRVAAEKQREDTRSELESTLAALPDLLFDVDDEGRIYDFRAPDPSLLAVPPEVFLHQKLSDVIPSDAAAVVHEALAEAHASGRSQGRRYRLTVQGTERWFEISVAPKRSDSLRPRFVAIARDITERIISEEMRGSLEAQLQQSQKMDAVGTLAAGIAHDFNNMLAIVGLNVAISRRDISGREDALEAIETAVRRAQDLVQQILSFSKTRPPNRAFHVINNVVRDATRLLRATIPPEIQVVVKPERDDMAVECEATQLHQVLLNLGMNAWQSIKGAGTITIGVDRVLVGASLPQPIKAGEYARIRVRDDGVGMPPETVERIFEPFFTTRAAGNGLGLSVVKSIVEAHGGTIRVESAVGRGTTVDVYLRASNAPARATEVGTQGGAPIIRVLVVDDEAALLRVTVLALEGAGFLATGFSSARDALEAVQAAPDAFDVVVTDLSMPELSGLALSSKLSAIRPELPIVLVSGHAPKADEQLAQYGIRFRLAKPFEIDVLDALLRGLVRR